MGLSYPVQMCDSKESHTECKLSHCDLYFALHWLKFKINILFNIIDIIKQKHKILYINVIIKWHVINYILGHSDLHFMLQWLALKFTTILIS